MSDSKNLFNICTGTLPFSYIPRYYQEQEIVSAFEDSYSGCLYFVTGIQGIGKTSFLKQLEQGFSQDNNWIVINSKPNVGLYQCLYSCLSQKLQRKGKTFFEYSNVELEAEIEQLLEIAKNKNKRVLFLVDDVQSAKETKAFFHSFQLYIRNDLPIFMIAAGTYSAVSRLSNHKTLTFLLRASKINLTNLRLSAVGDEYKRLLNASDETAIKMAKLTKGYPLAFQILGSLVSAYGNYDDSLLWQYDELLAECAYDDIYRELSAKEIILLKTVLTNNIVTVRKLIAELGITQKDFSVYRDRLIKKSIIVSKKRGEFMVALPRFAEYLENKERKEKIKKTFE